MMSVNRLDIKVERANWFSTYHVHHRVAEHFREGRAFLLGDPAHIHSPVGGQGMNTGIGDAVNLAWKLAAVLQGRASIQLLDSYEPERIAFAWRLVATTDRAFQFINNDGPIARLVRVRLVPLLLPALFSFREARRLMFLTLSQTNVNYRDRALAAGSAGRVQAGDRLPWVCPEDETVSRACAASTGRRMFMATRASRRRRKPTRSARARDDRRRSGAAGKGATTPAVARQKVLCAPRGDPQSGARRVLREGFCGDARRGRGGAGGRRQGHNLPQL
jgi:FAD binding domain